MKKNIAVIDLDTGLRYGSLSEAATALYIKRETLLSCKNQRRIKCCGHHLKFEESKGDPKERREMTATKYFKKQVEDWMPRTIQNYKNCVIGNERVYRFGIIALENSFRDHGMTVVITPVKDMEDLDPTEFYKPRNKKALDYEITFIATERKI